MASPMKSEQLLKALSVKEAASNDTGVILGDQISVLNDEIEKSLIDGVLTTDSPSSIKDTARLLHSTLISFLLQRSNEIGCQIDFDAMKEKFECLKSFSATDGGFLDLDDDTANRIALSIADDISNSNKISEDNETNDVDLQCVYTCAQLIRASKNLICWNRLLFMHMRKTKTNVSGSDSYVSSATRLCSLGMVSLYMHILKSIMCNSKGPASQDSKLKYALDDLAIQCATALFQSTFCQAPEPCCKKALNGFIADFSGIMTIAKLLVEPTECSTALLLCVIKIVHNIIGSANHASKFDDALAKCDAPHLNQNQPPLNTNLFTILVINLSWALRSEPAFPSQLKGDKRSDLIIEIIRVLFALRNGNAKAVAKMEADNQEIMTQMGIIIVDILKLPHRDKRCYECKLGALLLLMNTPKDYGSFLVVNNVVEELLAIFLFQLNTIIVEGAGDVQSESNATTILPILIVLNQLVDGNMIIREKVKTYIFPTEDEENFQTKVNDYRKMVANTPESQRASKKNMQPLDAPVGTTRWKLIKLMTWTESNVKRYSSELLWNICRKDPNEFMLRCGFGNAVHMLGIKGLYKIPK